MKRGIKIQNELDRFEDIMKKYRIESEDYSGYRNLNFDDLNKILDYFQTDDGQAYLKVLKLRDERLDKMNKINNISNEMDS